jgi:hypothetical protein
MAWSKDDPPLPSVIENVDVTSPAGAPTKFAYGCF